ncbi:MAG: response regulator transcription factor [Bacteroidales bacterium]|nr:response regulator transcription factor [Bacteroidales bacterium]MBP5234538.1 response regulator transcription factor [Bacteroidales bacterium]
MIRCIIVDDEPLAIKMLENYVERTPFLKLEASYTDPVIALSGIREKEPELVFLDIQMPDLNGMELSRMIPSGTRIIFTTAFKQFAFESYEVSALDFLLKPIRYLKFLEAAEKARKWFEMKEAAESSAESRNAQKTSIFIKTEGNMLKVLLSDIKYIEGMRDYVLVHTKTRKQPYVTHITMKAVEEMLPEDSFMRVHRSYIVALSSITSVSGTNDILIGDNLIHVSDAYRERFENYLKGNSLNR